MGWDGMGWDGMVGWDGMGWDEIGWSKTNERAEETGQNTKRHAVGLVNSERHSTTNEQTPTIL